MSDRGKCKYWVIVEGKCDNPEKNWECAGCSLWVDHCSIGRVGPSCDSCPDWEQEKGG